MMMMMMMMMMIIIIIIISSITVFAGFLFVHHHTLSTFLRIRADPNMQYSV